MKRGVWSEEEHARFLDAIRHYPEGPWSKIASCIGSRSARQVQTHAQRYYEKVQRHVRGLQRDRSKSTHKEHRIDEDILRLQHLHRVAKSSARSSRADQSDGKDLTDQEPHRRLYRSKDPPPCLQRLTGLPAQHAQLSPVGVNDMIGLSPQFETPPPSGYHDHQQSYQYPPMGSLMYSKSRMMPPSRHQYARRPELPSFVASLPSPHRHRGFAPMPPLGSIAPRLSDLRQHDHPHSYMYPGYAPSSTSPTSLSSPHDSQVIASSIRGPEDPHRRPTLTWSQPGLLLPRIFS